MEDNAAQNFILAVCAKNREFYDSDLGQGALKDFQQTFPHPWLYVGELLQNAVDAGATRIRLAVEGSSLVFEHDGAAFEERHVVGLCSRGMSTKGAASVGFMGIGFKAVFHSFECVDVASGPWRFRLCVTEEIGEYGERQRDWLGCALPTFVESISGPSAGMRCRFVMHGRLDRLAPIGDDIGRVLSADLLVLALLARRGVREVEWNGQRWALSQVEHALTENQSRVLLDALDEKTGNIQQWILFSSTYQPSREAIGRFLEHRGLGKNPTERAKVYAEAKRTRTVEAFCPLDASGNPLPPRHGQAHALLPTDQIVPIGLHLQADWLLNTSRRELMDVETNRWHQEILAQLPGLLRAYLEWVTQLPPMPDARLADAYAVFPSWDDAEETFASYLASPLFRDSLRETLADLAFLPVRRHEGIRFAAPGDALLLPTELQVFDSALLCPWELFGGDIISTVLLGSPARASLEGIALLQPLTPKHAAPTMGAG